jgi:hypothetical protein
VKLLGIYTGAWDGEPGVILSKDRNLRGGMRVPVGMGTVVPIHKLIQLIREHPVIKEIREKKVVDKLFAKAAVMGDAFPSASDVESNNTNPKHREDFTRLVGAAARKPARED